MQGRIPGERPESPVQTPPEKAKFKKEVLHWVVSRGRGSFPDWQGFAKSWNNDVNLVETPVRDQLLVEDNEEDGSADDASPSSSVVRFADRLNRMSSAGLSHY